MTKKISRVYNEAENRAYPVVDKEARAALEAKADRSDFANSGWIDEFSFNSKNTEFDVPYFNGGALWITAQTLDGNVVRDVASVYLHIDSRNTATTFTVDNQTYTATIQNHRKILIAVKAGSTYHHSLRVYVICGVENGYVLKSIISPSRHSGLKWDYKGGHGLELNLPSYMFIDYSHQGQVGINTSRPLVVKDNVLTVPIGPGLQYDSSNQVLTLLIGNSLAISSNKVDVKCKSGGGIGCTTDGIKLNLPSSGSPLHIDSQGRLTLSLGAGLKYDSTNDVLIPNVGLGLELSGRVVRVKLKSDGAIINTSDGIKLNLPSSDSPLYIDSNNQLQVNQVDTINPDTSDGSGLTTVSAVKDYVHEQLKDVNSGLKSIKARLAALEAAAAENGWTV
jgi:hypothetical protein